MKSYTKLIDEALLKRQAEDESNYFPLRPSAAGYCARRLAYDLLDYIDGKPYQEEKEPESIRLLNLGSSVEWHSIRNFDLISNIDPNIKVKFKQQAVTLFRLNPVKGEKVGRLIEGSIDGAIQDGEFLNIFDVKSKKDRHHTAFKTEWDATTSKLNEMESTQVLGDCAWFVEDLPAFLNELNDEWFAHNFLQVNAYCNTQWFKDHNGRHGVIYRYNKNDSRHIEIHFKPHAGLFKKLEDKFNLIYKTVLETRNPDLVPSECILGTSATAFSRCKDCCWKEDALKAYFNTFPKKTWPKDAKEIGEEVQHLIEIYEQTVPAVDRLYTIEKDLAKALYEKNVQKVKADSGKIYEVKNLKTEGLVIRRSKL